MDSFLQQRPPAPNNFLGLFSNPPPPAAAGATANSPISGGDELDEDDILWTENDSSEPNHPSSMSTPNPNPNPNPNPRQSLFRPVHRRFPERDFGILAALPDEDKKHTRTRTRPLLQRKTFSAVVSPSSSARMIPIPNPNPNPNPKAEYSISVAGGKIYRQSAPVNVPIVPVRVRRGWEEHDGDDVEEEEMLPPHEIVARAASKESPLTAFSMLEGVGRTLKGRDLRRVRNAVWRQTGFLD